MPYSRFTAKEDREAHHIAESEMKRGKTKKEALRIGYATVQSRRHDRKYDPWENPRFVKKFTCRVEILYMTRKDMEDEVEKGHIPESEFKRYWPAGGPKHLDEIALIDPPQEIIEWAKSWRHNGKDDYSAGIAVRAGGANQHKDPLNLFIVYK